MGNLWLRFLLQGCVFDGRYLWLGSVVGGGGGGINNGSRRHGFCFSEQRHSQDKLEPKDRNRKK